MAYLRPLDPRCQECPRRASFELFSNRNVLIGWFCQNHSVDAQARQQDRENAARPSTGCVAL